MPTEKLTFKIEWKESSPAKLTYLIDNGSIIISPAEAGDDISGTREITFTYDAPRSDIHIIRWLLWFPERSLSKLVATARRNTGKKFVPLNSEPGEQAIRWESSGAL
ncbi:hypothetical protein SAMN05443572_11420 [Myxococcus fulvus]|uniref:Uncharacterized protein n=1 Tax=Myxococcus fulvus TaxID=33 RepID=A0A511TAF6_MYXFU|nr:hypothetical protein [Myxococcus fulvus]BDT38653.1 hypothetical protein MFMH1_83220 [Myxococcus sp. MH1]GEN11170.1 hypothetical protein MFU01_62070 [Myxococcus fulvus]SEU39391.1 hypothetical protein SAMN05443572_11420 [Myxococcus fulvus]